jgi:thiol-disulfide isomerase/thioredoxin
MLTKAEYHFFLPPGTFTLDAYGTDTQHARKTITVKPGQRELEVEPIDLPPTGLVLLEGKPAPELRDIAAWKNGGPVKLADLRGKVVILAFTAGWSGPRLHGIMPELFPLYDKYRDQGLAIVEIRLDMGLGIDSKATVDERVAEVTKPFWPEPKPRERIADVKKPLWKDRDLPVPIALVLMNRVPPRPDAKAKPACAVLEDYGLTGFPTGVLIDRQGRVVGPFDPRRDSGDAVVEKTLKEK